MRPDPTTPDDDRRRFWRAAALVFGVVGVLLVLIIAVATLEPSSKAQRQDAHDRALGQPESLVEPNAGQAPKHSGDPGGWEQLALLGVLVVAIGGGGAWVVHTSRTARRRTGDRGTRASADPAS
jgi:hypothetical protein